MKKCLYLNERDDLAAKLKTALEALEMIVQIGCAQEDEDDCPVCIAGKTLAAYKGIEEGEK